MFVLLQFKLHTMVVSMCWSSDSNMLTALADGKVFQSFVLVSVLVVLYFHKIS